jgi:hypothetical protein
MDKETKTQEATQEQTQTTPKEMMEVDIDGISVKVEYEVGKKMIEKRQEKHKLFKEISEKATQYEKELSETRKKLEFETAAKRGLFAEAEALAQKGVTEKLNKLQNAIIQKELKSELISNPEFIGSEAIEDALKLLGSDFQIDETNEVVSKDGKKAKDVVSEFVKAKANFRKAKIVKGLEATSNDKVKIKKEVRGDINAQAIEKFFGK